MPRRAAFTTQAASPCLLLTSVALFWLTQAYPMERACLEYNPIDGRLLLAGRIAEVR